MLSADWQSTGAAAVGIVGLAAGVWWLDAAAAIFIAVSVIGDGVRNTRRTAGGLLDRMPTEMGSDHVVDLVGAVEAHAQRVSWSQDVEVRLREEGTLYAGEVFVGAEGQVGIDQLDELTHELRRLDWRLQEIVVVPVKAAEGDDVHRTSWLGARHAT
jgi:divalent metal cation (Fe/Co/Zn/Cd) transporter